MRVRKNVAFGTKVVGLAWGLLIASALPVLAQTGTLSALSIANLSPAFSSAVKVYSIPRTASCSVPVTATLTNPAHKLYVASGETASGVMRQAWVCDGRTKIDIVIYAGWTEVGRYTVNVVGSIPPPPPPPAPSTLSSLVVANMTPAFDPMVKNYSIPRTAACSVPVTATLTNAALKLQIQNTDTASGVTRQAYVCEPQTKISVVLYQVWTEVGRYTITLVGPAPPPGPPPPPPPPPVPPTEPLLIPSPAPVFTDALPVPTPVDSDVAQRLLHQATFGPSPADMAAVQANGVDRWLTEQFQKPASAIPDGLDVNALRAHIFTNMATGADQLRQRVMFALSQTLVVSANKNVNGYELIPWWRLLSTHAFGNYRAILREVTVSPSMGKFLDLANSIGGALNISANENYPRELLQLFSIGIWKLNQDGTLKLENGNAVPAYTQATIAEVARALSGWTYPTAPGAPYRSTNNEYMVGLMEARPGNHDRGAKTIFGTTIPANQTVTDDMEDVLDIIFAHENVPPFVATRLIRALVTSNPKPAYIQRVADKFVDNGQGVRGDLRAVITAILTDPDADMPELTDGRLMDPVLNVIGFGRALDAEFGDANQFQYILGNLGQHMLTPASVFSFYSPLAPLPGSQGQLFGPEFSVYPPALTIHRANFIYSILTGQMNSAIKVNLAPYVALAGNPQALVSLVDQTLLQGRMSIDLRAILVSATGAVSDPTQRAIGALYLTAISSEFLVHAGY